MLIEAMGLGAMAGALHECGVRGIIPHYGRTNDIHPAAKLFMAGCLMGAAAYEVETIRGFWIVGLSTLGAFTLARLMCGAVIHIWRGRV